MLKASPPPRFSIPFAAGAGGGFIRAIPQSSQIGINNGWASLTDGFPPLNFTPIAAGGVPPFGQDINGIFNQISLWCQWQEAGGPVFFDATFATGGNGGYPLGAVVRSSIHPSNRWFSLVDNNTVDPDSFGQTTWVPDPAMVAPGTVVPSFSPTVGYGYLAANANTIGNAASNATTANAATQLLYRNQWLNFSNSFCPVFTSAGVPTTRGANPDADFAANKQLQLIDMRGIGLIGADTMGGAPTTRLAGVPVNAGSATAPGSFIGENLHALVTAELAVHSHANTLSDPQHNHSYTTVTYTNTASGSGNAQLNTGGATSTTSSSTGITITNANAGSGTAHNTVPFSRTVFWNLKL